jgi:hypothetical protein
MLDNAWQARSESITPVFLRGMSTGYTAGFAFIVARATRIAIRWADHCCMSNAILWPFFASPTHIVDFAFILIKYKILTTLKHLVTI